MKRLLIAVPVAAVVVAALFLAMRGFVPAERPRAEYRIVVLEETVQARLPDREREVIRNGHPPPKPPPPSTYSQSGSVDSQPMPREPFPEPKRKPPDSESLARGSGLDIPDRFVPRWPKDAKDGDYVVLEFTISDDGHPTDIEVIESSNPGINEYAIRTVQRWKYRPKERVKGTEPGRVQVRFEFRKEERDR